MDPIQQRVVVMEDVDMRKDEIEIIPGVIGPRECHVNNWIMPHGPGGNPVAVRLRFDEERRRYVCDEITVSRAGQPHAGPITSDVLRSIAVNDLISMIITSTLLIHSDTGMHLRDLPNPDGCEPWGRVLPNDVAQQGPTDRALQWVAHMYRLAVAIEMAPTKTIQEEFGLSRSTAIRWVMSARAKGFLGEASMGKAGEKG
ncbi:hypothetical protein [Nonomuraea guangzhouensis]|uniref:Helix-turn-helix domain-containing protein n=1 Tax=Nonomuraea guangzhouensis TaxID=1291555 RepID=A0ABW4GTE0_9ACTN|nr:hypothetical protein [Nonomuraea guangzhouensis]